MGSLGGCMAQCVMVLFLGDFEVRLDKATVCCSFCNYSLVRMVSLKQAQAG